MIAVVLAACTREVERPATPPAPGPIINRYAISPGIVLFLGLVGLAGFSAFVRLYAEDLDLSGAGGIFLIYGVIVLLVRIFGARLPDRLGSRRVGHPRARARRGRHGDHGGVVELAGLFVGDGGVRGRHVAAVPGAPPARARRVPDTERASVVGTVSSFFDLSQGIGALVLGGVAELGGYRAAFGVAGAVAVVGLVVLWTIPEPDRHEPALEAEIVPA